MEMKRIEAETLEEAYSKAAKELSCSITEINYEIVQHPNTGMMGLFKKPAIIIAVKKIVDSTVDKEKDIENKNSSIGITETDDNRSDIENQPKPENEQIENSTISSPVKE